MRLIYTIGIHLYHISIHIAGFFSSKANKWVDGRKDLFVSLEREIGPQQDIVWFHCASLGEFEQGRPLIEEYRKSFPKDKILLTFFSPSGYEVRKTYEGADYVSYLPIDTPKNVKQFLDTVQPKRVFFIKYEFWFNFLKEIQKRNIPSFLVSGIFRPNQLFFQYYGQWTIDHLCKFTHLFVQDKASAQLLAEHNIKNYSIAGDTRFDRVLKVAQNFQQLPDIEKFCNAKFILVAGSSWEQEDELIQKLVEEEHFEGKVIIAPHEIGSEKILKLQKIFMGKAVLWSNRNEVDLIKANVLIIDKIGLLSSIYKYAHVAIIGGGFGKGVHNTLEAATFGVPILVGPHYEKFKEVEDLISIGAAIEISNQSEFNAIIKKLQQFENIRSTKGQLAKKYVKENSGATRFILNYLNNT